MAITNRQTINLIKPTSGTSTSSNTSTSSTTNGTSGGTIIGYTSGGVTKPINTSTTTGGSSSSSSGSQNKTYTIGSSAGIQAANDLAVGDSFTATDGSVWTKDNSGNITVNKGGNTYTGVYDYNNIDYTAEIKNAVDSGNYGLASQLESQRNDKIDWLNATNTNVNNYGKTNVYENYNSILDLPDNWTSAIVGGNTYTRDESGKMYNESGNLLGDGYNANTNEFTFSNENDALNAMYTALKAEHGLENVSDEEAIAYLQSQGLLNRNLLNAYMTGSVGQYNDYVAEQKRLEEERLAMYAELQEQQELQQQQYAAALAQQQTELEEYIKQLQEANQTSNQDSKYKNFIRTLLRKNFIY